MFAKVKNTISAKAFTTIVFNNPRLKPRVIKITSYWL